MATSNPGRKVTITPRSITNHRLFVSLAIAIITFAAHFQLVHHLPASRTVDDHIRHQTSSSTIMATNYEDYIKEDYRAFVFATHPTHGMLLLQCTRKKKKPPHFQAPGGHIDKEDFEEAVAKLPETSHQGPAVLIHASKIGAARELFEETGIDIRSSLDRLQPVRLRENSKDKLICELKNRVFFKICLDDSDFVTSGNESKVSMGLTQPLNNKPEHLMLKLSHEHQGFKFEPDATKSADLLVEHSGGKVSKALRKAIEQGDIGNVENDAGTATIIVEENVDNIVGNPMEREKDEMPEKKGKLFDCFDCC